MTILTLPYIVPLFLGMTFDARTSKPGVSIFEEISTPDEVNIPYTISTYKVVTEMSDIRKQLEISGDLALKIKTGNLDVKGAGSYIKNEENNQNSVVLLSTFRHVARTLSIPDNAKRRDWLAKFDKSVIGTHYVQSITYGVEMVAALKFTASKGTSLSDISVKLQASFGSENKTWDADAKGQLKNCASELKDISDMEIMFFGTLPLTSIPNTIEGLQKLIGEFGDLVKAAGLEKGLPMSVTLWELDNLDEAKGDEHFDYETSREVVNKYSQFVDKFDKLSSARNKLYSWTRSLPYDLDEGDSSKIGTELEKLNVAIDECYKLMANVDLTKNPTQFNSVLNNRFKFRDIDDLIIDLDRKVDNDIHTTSATYVHWGNTSCVLGDDVQAVKNRLPTRAVPLFEGYAVGSTKEGVGGFVRFDCMPVDGVKPAYSLGSDQDRSLITGMRYGDLGQDKRILFKTPTRLVELQDKVVPCAKCHQLDASTVSMFPATTTCPRYWDLKYTGYLMSPATSESHSGKYICVDEYPIDPRFINDKVTDQDNSIDLTVILNEGSLPQEEFGENKIVRCAVCALKGGRIL